MAEPDYFSYHTKVKLTLYEKGEVCVKLEERNPLISVSIISDVECCEIFIDDEKCGLTPCKCELRRGKHKVEVRKKGYKSKTYYVVFSKSGDCINLLPGGLICGQIKINTPHIGAEVFLDGKSAGQNPLILRNVPTGFHNIGMMINKKIIYQTIDIKEDEECVVTSIS